MLVANGSYLERFLKVLAKKQFPNLLKLNLPFRIDQPLPHLQRASLAHSRKIHLFVLIIDIQRGQEIDGLLMCLLYLVLNTPFGIVSDPPLLKCPYDDRLVR